jgi:hypothetical protein
MEVFDDKIDRSFLDMLSHKLSKTLWDTNNIANRSSWPEGLYGTHRLLGNTIYDAEVFAASNDIAKNPDNRELETSIYYDIQALSDNHLGEVLGVGTRSLSQVHLNLQFKGMEGSLHIDGPPEALVCLIMLTDGVVEKDSGGGFFHAPTETTVPYRYGRIVSFSADELHKGNSFIDTELPRYTIKLVYKEIQSV